MNRVEHYGIIAIALLSEKKASLNEIADRLCLCTRQTQRVLKHLKDNGYVVHSGIKGRTKLFWVEDSSDFLPAILTKAQNQAIQAVLNDQNENLKAAIYRLTQYVNMQLYLSLNK